jgi:hypothetical protein
VYRYIVPMEYLIVCEAENRNAPCSHEPLVPAPVLLEVMTGAVNFYDEVVVR